MFPHRVFYPPVVSPDRKPLSVFLLFGMLPSLFAVLTSFISLSFWHDLSCHFTILWSDCHELLHDDLTVGLMLLDQLQKQIIWNYDIIENEIGYCAFHD